MTKTDDDHDYIPLSQIPDGYIAVKDSNNVTSWVRDPLWKPEPKTPDAWYQSILSIQDKQKRLDQQIAARKAIER